MCDATNHVRLRERPIERKEGFVDGNLRYSLARNNHAPDDQQPCAAVSLPRVQLRYQHHRFHDHHPCVDDPSDGSTNEPDEEDAGYSAEDEEDTGQVQGQVR